ncbi:MAG: DUF3422 family protein [Paracoccaceae bacterium]
MSYYAVSLVSYVMYPATLVLNVSKGMLTAAVTVPVVLLVWALVRRIRQMME